MVAREPDNRAARRREANRAMREFLIRLAAIDPECIVRADPDYTECIFCQATGVFGGFRDPQTHASDCLYRECVTWLAAHRQSDSSSPAPTRTSR